MYGGVEFVLGFSLQLTQQPVFHAGKFEFVFGRLLSSDDSAASLSCWLVLSSCCLASLSSGDSEATLSRCRALTRCSLTCLSCDDSALSLSSLCCKYNCLCLASRLPSLYVFLTAHLFVQLIRIED